MLDKDREAPTDAADDGISPAEAEKALRESEARFRGAVEGLLDAFAILKPIRDESGRIVDFRFEYINHVGLELAGKTWDEFVGHTSSQLFPRTGELGLFDRYVRVAETGEPLKLEAFPFQERLGAYQQGIYLDIQISRLPPDLLAFSWRDVSERVHAQLALKDREQEYRTLAENAPEVIARFDRQLRHTYVNEYGAKVYGLTKKEVIGKTNAELGMPPDKVAFWKEHFEQVFAIGRQQTVDFDFVSPAFGHRYFSSIFVPEFNDKGEVESILAITRDVTDLRTIEQELRRSRDLLESIVDNLPAAIYIKDLKGTITLANKALGDVLGVSRADIIGKTSYDFYPREVAEAHIENDREIMRRGEAVSFEEIVPEDGSVRTFLSIKFPLRDSNGSIYGIGGVSSEITERVRAEEALARALEVARKDRERLEAMESIAEAGISTTEIGEVLKAVADRIAHSLGTHSCTIFLPEGSNTLVARAAHGIPEDVGFRINASEGFIGRILSTQRTVYVRDAEHDPLAISPHIKRTGVKSLLGTPLVARGQVVGAVYVDEIRIREYSPEERRLLQTMASRVALIVENARLYQGLMKSRDEIQSNFSFLQRSLLPPEELEVGPGYRASAAYLSPFGLEVGGDFYDVFDSEAGRHIIMIGDVAGKGVPAVSLATATRSTIRALAYDIPSVGDALTHANAVLYPQQFTAGELAFVTAFLASIDPVTGEFCYASAGHPPPAIYRNTDGSVDFLEAANPPLRVTAGLPFRECSSFLLPGDRMILYTDGLNEARRDSEMFDLEGIQRVVRECGRLASEDLVERLLKAASDWAGGGLTDDTAVLVIERET